MCGPAQGMSSRQQSPLALTSMPPPPLPFSESLTLLLCDQSQSFCPLPRTPHPFISDPSAWLPASRKCQFLQNTHHICRPLTWVIVGVAPGLCTHCHLVARSESGRTEFRSGRRHDLPRAQKVNKGSGGDLGMTMGGSQARRGHQPSNSSLASGILPGLKGSSKKCLIILLFI